MRYRQNSLTEGLDEFEEFTLRYNTMVKFQEVISNYERMQLKKVDYETLNARQKETHNFHVVSGKLATYGFEGIRINADWEGVDFLSWQMTTDRILKLQLKSRPTIAKNIKKKIFGWRFQSILIGILLSMIG